MSGHRLTPAAERLNRLKLAAVVASMVSFGSLTTLIAAQVSATPVSAASGTAAADPAGTATGDQVPPSTYNPGPIVSATS